MDLQKHFHKYNLFVGWGVFLIALLTYGLSVEPTVSFWDCGEYIATSAKLEVGHPPGAPFFQMVGAFFASFSPSPEMTALFVNFISVFSSAFTILFLYFIIVNFTQKIVLAKGDTLTNGQVIAIYGSGVVGALAYTFSDSFWFNATEAEVYAMAMLFMSAMFWLGLKWTDNLDSPRGDKWLLLIALVVGLSFGVHFMALLTIPAIGMLYFFQSHFKKNVKNFILANVISISILLLIFKLILPYTLALFGHTEVFFVNTLHLPFNSGTIFTGVWIIAAFAFTLRKAQKHQKRLLQTATLCLLFVFVGFSSWLMIPIRSNAGTVINENSPTDARLLLAYYNLEQYQKTYLFKGPMYSDQFAPPVDYTDEKPKYERDYKAHRYIIVNNYKDALEAPNPNHIGLLPRMWSGEHAANYMSLTTPLKYRVNPKYMGSQEVEYMNQELQAALYAGDLEKYTNKLRDYQLFFIVEKPSFWDNLSFMFSYQFDYMYLRYLLWNFVGRQDDIQGKISNNHGNWISGISFIDEWHTGYPQDHLPSDAQNNRGRNTYFFLPLLLGLVGLFFQFSSSKRQWWAVSVLFLFTGLALKVYLNERPFEPRERDYALVGSFFTFAIWIGMGVYALYSLLQEKLSFKWIAPGVVLLCVLVVPARMLTENWDDHDRSNRYTARALGKSYLDSVSKDNGAMIFSIGDNDTFGMWYMQEVEHYRTDVRVINTSLLGTDWYIDQMKCKAYTSDPIPSQLEHRQYAYGVRDVIYFDKKTNSTWPIKDLMKWVSSDDPKDQLEKKRDNAPSIFYSSYPTNKIRIPVNKENVLKSGIVKPEDADKIVDYIDIRLPSYGMGKNRLLMLDIIANNDWKRPIYFTGGSYSDEEYIWMRDYLQLDGMAYKLVPIKTPIDKDNPYDMGRIDGDLMYDIVKSWDWGNMDDPNIYHDPETRRNTIVFRGNLARLTETLIAEDKLDKAKDIIDIATTRIPINHIGYYFTLEPFISGYYAVKEPEKARQLFLEVARKYQEKVEYYLTFSQLNFIRLSDEIAYDLRRYQVLLLSLIEDRAFFKEQKAIYDNYIDRLKKLGKAYGFATEEEPSANDQEDSLQAPDPEDSTNLGL